MEPEVIRLSNGILMVHLEQPYTRLVHCGVVINAGSRNESADEQGLAHFLEHMTFKGTEKRKTFHILNYLESVGGDLNAYTTKEKTCYYASLNADYFERAIDLLTDITFRSTYPSREVIKEKQVISEEIDMYRDAPDEAILEDFDKIVFPDHPLGNPILGTKDTISLFTREHLLTFTNRHYVPENVVLSVFGRVKRKKAIRIAEKYLGEINKPLSGQPTIETGSHMPQHLSINIPGQQAHQIIGGRAFPIRKELYYAFYLLNNYLGGPAMNSRLNLNIREKKGLTYNLYTFYNAFIDSGNWGVYFACEPGNLNRINGLIRKELNEMRAKPLGSMKLSQLKKQLLGQYMLSHENLLTRMLSSSKDILDFGKHLRIDEVSHVIDRISAAEVQEAARIVFDESKLSTITYKPT